LLQRVADGEVDPEDALDSIEEEFETGLQAAMVQKTEAIFDGYAAAALSCPALATVFNPHEIAQRALAIAVECMKQRTDLIALFDEGEDAND
jgi:hypothetical protein